MVIMRLSGTVIEIFSLEDIGDDIGHVTIELPMGRFLLVFNGDQASIWHGY